MLALIDIAINSGTQNLHPSEEIRLDTVDIFDINIKLISLEFDSHRCSSLYSFIFFIVNIILSVWIFLIS